MLRGARARERVDGRFDYRHFRRTWGTCDAALRINFTFVGYTRLVYCYFSLLSSNISPFFLSENTEYTCVVVVVIVVGKRLRWNGASDNASNGNEIRSRFHDFHTRKMIPGLLTNDLCASQRLHMRTSLSRLFSKTIKGVTRSWRALAVHFYFRFTGHSSGILVPLSMPSRLLPPQLRSRA